MDVRDRHHAIVVWLFAGNIIGFDKTPWPLLLTLLNLPQLSIMISLQVAANRAQAASDARAVASYETLVALQGDQQKQLDPGGPGQDHEGPDGAAQGSTARCGRRRGRDRG